MKSDVVILGTGSAGEMLASLLAESGKSVLVIESHLLGGECPFYSCMPSKAMLRSAAARFDATHTVEVGATSTLLKLDDRREAFAAAVARREKICEGHSDSGNEKNLNELGVKIIRGLGSITKAGTVRVDSRDFEYSDLVIATGSKSVIPPIPGLDQVDFWTTDKALTSSELPDSLIIVGGGPAGCELAQIFSRFGTKVTVIEPGEHLLGKEDKRISLILGEVFKSEGIEIIFGSGISHIETSNGEEITVVLENGQSVTAGKLLVATGRKPNVEGIGLEHLGIEVGKFGAIQTQENCRVIGQENVWASGDVAGIAPLVHTANYQARIIAAVMTGNTRSANYNAIPRSVYTSPPVASVGINYADAIEAGIDAITASSDIANTARNTVDGYAGGLLVLTANRKTKTLIGAAAIGPHCDEWIAEAVLAIRAEISLKTLVDVVHAFPTYGEAFEGPYRELLTASEPST
jgi:dihydrolipoamide dehydrogenase